MKFSNEILYNIGNILKKYIFENTIGLVFRPFRTEANKNFRLFLVLFNLTKFFKKLFLKFCSRKQKVYLKKFFCFRMVLNGLKTSSDSYLRYIFFKEISYELECQGSKINKNPKQFMRAEEYLLIIFCWIVYFLNRRRLFAVESRKRTWWRRHVGTGFCWRWRGGERGGGSCLTPIFSTT